jgi:peptide deformylase
MTEATGNDRIRQTDPDSLKIIYYPDPRLEEISVPIDVCDDHVAALVERMFELMFAARGVGLAAPQVALTVRLFLATPTFQPEDRQVFINPRIVSADGVVEDDEGCLSFPEISCKIKRSARVVVEAIGLDGRTFTCQGEGLAARIYQHEIDHLDGRLLIDRMGAIARLANRRALKSLENRFAAS